jgi:hypothetical protein
VKKNPNFMFGWDWTSSAASAPGRPKTLTMLINVMGGLRGEPGASVWTALYALTEDPSSAMAQAALRCLNYMEKEIYGTQRCHCTCAAARRALGLTSMHAAFGVCVP